MIRIAPQPGASPQIGKRQAHIGDAAPERSMMFPAIPPFTKACPHNHGAATSNANKAVTPWNFALHLMNDLLKRLLGVACEFGSGCNLALSRPAPFRTVYRKLFRRVNQALQSVKPSKIPSLVRRTIQKFLWYDVIPQQMPLVKLFAPSSSIWLREPRL